MTVRKPVLINDTAKPMPQLAYTSANAMRRSRGDADVLRINSKRPLLLLANITSRSSVGLDDTNHSHDMSQKALKAIFHASPAGKSGEDFLTVCKGKPIHFLGASGGIVPTKHISHVPKGNRPGITEQDVVTKKYENVAVYSDFPKGGGGIEGNKLWQDGTYDNMVAEMSKKHTGLPEHINFQPAVNPRQERYELAGQVGAIPFGDALHRQEIKKYFDNEKEQYELSAFMNMGMSEADARNAILGIAREKDIQAIGKKFNISEKGARGILRDYYETSNLGLNEEETQRLEADRLAQLEAMYQRTPDAPRRPEPSAVRNPNIGVTGSGAGDGNVVRFKTAGIPAYPYGYSPIGTMSMEELSKRKATDKGKRYDFTPEQARYYQASAIARNNRRTNERYQTVTNPINPVGRPRAI